MNHSMAVGAKHVQVLKSRFGSRLELVGVVTRDVATSMKPSPPLTIFVLKLKLARLAP